MKNYIIHKMCNKCEKIKRRDTNFPEDPYNYHGYGDICNKCLEEITPEDLKLRVGPDGR